MGEGGSEVYATHVGHAIKDAIITKLSLKP